MQIAVGLLSNEKIKDFGVWNKKTCNQTRFYSYSNDDDEIIETHIKVPGRNRF